MVITVVVIIAVVDWQEIWRCPTWCLELMVNVVGGKCRETSWFILCELVTLDMHDAVLNR